MPLRLSSLLLSAALLYAQSRDAEVAQHLQKGIQAGERRDTKLALAEFRQAVALDPSRAESHARLGMTYQESGMLPEAAASFAQALKLSPNLPGVGLLLGFTYQAMGRNRDAIPHLSKALETESEVPVRVLAGQRLIDACFATGETGRGLQALETLRNIAPDDPDVLYTASKVYANLWNSSVEHLVQTAPGSYRVHQVFAEVFEAQDRFADAAKEYRTIIQMVPNLPGAHYRLGRMLLRGADNPETDHNALAEFQKELEISPLDVPTFTEIGEIHLRAQHFEDAARHFSRALELQPGYVRAKIGLAKVLLAQKQNQKALTELEAAARLAPEDESIHYNLMLAYRGLGRAADAQRAYAEFQKLKTRQQQNQSSILKQLKGMPSETPR